MNKVILFIAVNICLIFASCNPKKIEKEAEGKYTVTSPWLTDTSFTKEYIAEIQSVQNVEIRAKVKGFIESVSVD
jgi:membrane fusion protein (multidrug efflux system)